jgi:signal recognition particle subunit SRP54
MEKRLRAGQFTFDDFLRAQKMLKRMGPFQNVLKLIPGMGKQLGDIDVDDRQLARVEAIVLSMTPRERALPHVIDGSRRARIAKGSGTHVQQVNQLLEARKQMEKLMKQMGKGKLPDLGAMQNGEAMPSQRPRPSATKKRNTKRKKNKKARR